MTSYTLLAETQESTVVAEYQSSASSDNSYQSEAALEKELIAQLGRQAYEVVAITSEQELVANLRTQLEALNDYRFSDAEWQGFFKNVLANANAGIVEKTRLIQEDHVQLLTREDGSTKNIRLIDKENIHNNKLQVTHQYATEAGLRANRYDVSLLVNGLPLVHIELKRRGVDLREAFNQINRYQHESFASGCGLFEFVQIFVISNGTYSKYYSNTTRLSHIKEQTGKQAQKGKRSSHSYEFTSWWADANNKVICDLKDFTATFLRKHSLLNILTKYCVFTAEQQLLVMRPYQIAATERILERIKIGYLGKHTGSVDAGGYVWHTTGSGKTLTSFKSAQLVSKLPYVDKVLFVVDRKDLDYQTMKEYDRFERGSVDGSSNTAHLKRNIEDASKRILVTTIQKLAIFIKKHPKHEAFGQRFVIIFDECHRSQFGEMHTAITRNFKNYYLFGFTGTPIFAANANKGCKTQHKTTQQAFGLKLHTYTIIDAISDRNVLPFRMDYVSTMRGSKRMEDEDVEDINREKALMAPERIKNIVRYILEHFDQKTKRNTTYKLKARRVAGFNSIFAVSSIDAAKRYYEEFKSQMQDLPADKRLKVGLIYSFGVNEDTENGVIEDEDGADTSKLDESSRDFLESAITDYNAMFKTNFSTAGDKFPNYYKDVSLRMKDRELDLLIVVNMFLTGFDATTLNTLWVDKNLRMHGLLQAYSRTNRILNSVKTFGNIVCFRKLEKATNASLALFGNKDAAGYVLLRTFKEYYKGYEDKQGKWVDGYEDLVKQLLAQFSPGQKIDDEEKQKEFILLYGAILKLKNILSAFDAFAGAEILTERNWQDYQSTYIDLYEKTIQRRKLDKKDINDDIVFEMELIKHQEINVSFILNLIRQYQDTLMVDKEIEVRILKAIDSSIELRNKKALIESFLRTVNPGDDVDEVWQAHVEKTKKEELDKLIEDEHLKKEGAYAFIKSSFLNGYVQDAGRSLSDILPPTDMFAPANEHKEKRARVLSKIVNFFDRYYDISSSEQDDSGGSLQDYKLQDEDAQNSLRVAEEVLN